MYYLFYNRKSKKVEHLSKKPLKKQSTNYYGEAEYYGELPNKYDYLTVINLQEKTDTWTEKEQVERLDEQGEIAYEENEVPKSRTYFTCELVANFRPLPTAEEIAKQKAQVRIKELKKLLDETDYQAIKFAEGVFPAEKYEPIKVQRQAWRDEINELEKI